MKLLYWVVALHTGLLLLSACAKPDLYRSNSALESKPFQAASATENFAVARQIAWDAAVIVQNPPHSVETWQEARAKWRQAIHLLEEISPNSLNSAEAKKKLPIYRANYAAINNRLVIEEKAVSNFEAAQTFAWQAAVTVQDPPHGLKVWKRAYHKWEDAIAQLTSIPNSASVYSHSQTKLATYRGNLNAINQRIVTEKQALLTLKQFSETATQLNKIPNNALVDSIADRVGISYTEYINLVQTLETKLSEFAQQPAGKKHPIYGDLEKAIADFKIVVKIWQAYLKYKQANAEWLYDEAFNQLVPLPFQDISMLVDKYGVKTYSSGTKVSLQFAAWTIWYQAGQHVRVAQQKVLNTN